jgi:site-specific recombinase XerD
MKMNMSARFMFGYWYVDFRFNQKRYRKRSPENSKRGAQAYERLLMSRLVSGEPFVEIVEKKKDFSTFAKEWFDTYVVANNKYSEQVTKESVLRVHLKPFFGKMLLEDIDSKQIEIFKRKQQAKGLNPKTINNHLTVLSKLLHNAIEWGEIDKIPLIKCLKCAQKRIRFLSESECQLLLTDQTEPLWRDMIYVALNTGMRMGELKGMRWEDINFKQSVIHVRRNVVRGRVTSPKNYKSRSIPMTTHLDNHLYSSRQKEGYVFEMTEDTPLTDKECVGGLWRLCKRAGMEKMGWHILRHSFASHLVMRGVPLRHVQQLLGHSSITMTERYSHLAPSSLHEAMQVLEDPSARFGQYVGSDKLLAEKIR